MHKSHLRSAALSSKWPASSGCLRSLDAAAAVSLDVCPSLMSALRMLVHDADSDVGRCDCHISFSRLNNVSRVSGTSAPNHNRIWAMFWFNKKMPYRSGMASGQLRLRQYSGYLDKSGHLLRHVGYQRVNLCKCSSYLLAISFWHVFDVVSNAGRRTF